MAKYTTAALSYQLEKAKRELNQKNTRLFYKGIFWGLLTIVVPSLSKKDDEVFDQLYSGLKPLDDKVVRLNSLLNARLQALQSYSDYKKGLCSHERALSHVIWYKRLKADPNIKGPIVVSLATSKMLDRLAGREQNQKY